MVLAAVICMLHHVGFDAIYWWCTWHPRETSQASRETSQASRETSQALFTSEQTESKTTYDTLNFF